MKKHLKILQKATALLLCLTLLFGCSGCFSITNTKNYDNDVEQIISGLYSETDNEEFAKYVNDLFVEAVTTDTLTLHSYLEHPENYGITDYEVTLGRYDTENLDNASEISEELNTLKAFDRTTLSKKQQITYDELMIYFENELEYSDLYFFQTDLSTTTGFHVQFPLILAEYTFLEEKDVKEYLEILKDSDEFFQSMADYETLRSQNGYFMEDILVNQIIEDCKSFVDSADDGYLITTFNEKIDALAGLSDSAKETYKASNKTAVTDHLMKGYNILIDTLTKLIGSNQYKGGLCNYPNGDKYFQYQLNHCLGWSKTIEEYDKLLDSYIQSNLTTMQALMKMDSTLPDQFSSFQFSLTEPKTILEDLKVKIQKDFPSGPDVTYDIKYITEALQDSVSPAMYFIPQLDNLSTNSIYINPAGTSGSSLYPTLAHEGYPGHLYQTTYFASSNPDFIRYLMAPNGYIEGWATYCELFSYSYADSENNLLNSLAQANYATILCLYAKCDIGIHYYGWTTDDIYTYISDFGFTDKEIASEMYKEMVSNPGNYCKYVLGWIGFSELKKEAQNQLGSAFSNLDFHKYILDLGPVPFDMLFERLDSWCKQAQYQ